MQIDAKKLPSYARCFFLMLGGEEDIFFSGCLRNVTFNNQAVQYLSMAAQPLGVTVSSTNVAEGCTSEDVCRSNPCPVNAECVDIWNSYLCPCLPGWEGVDCSSSVDDCIGKKDSSRFRSF